MSLHFKVNQNIEWAEVITSGRCSVAHIELISNLSADCNRQGPYLKPYQFKSHQHTETGVDPSRVFNE